MPSLRIFSLVVAAFVSQTGTPTAALPPQIERVLNRWEESSSRLASPSKAARKRALQKLRPRYSGHEISVLLEFRGPVSREQLLERYEFKSLDRSSGLITLKAVPRDEVERLFYDGFHLALDQRTWLPREIAFTGGRSGEKTRTLTVLSEQERLFVSARHKPVSAPVPEGVRPASGEVRPLPDSGVASGVITAEGTVTRMPLLLGAHWRDALRQLEPLGCDVRLRRGEAAPESEQVFHVSGQSPAPGQTITNGTRVELTVYDRPDR